MNSIHLSVIYELLGATISEKWINTLGVLQRCFNNRLIMCLLSKPFYIQPLTWTLLFLCCSILILPFNIVFQSWCLIYRILRRWPHQSKKFNVIVINAWYLHRHVSHGHIVAQLFTSQSLCSEICAKSSFHVYITVLSNLCLKKTNDF